MKNGQITLNILASALLIAPFPALAADAPVGTFIRQESIATGFTDSQISAALMRLTSIGNDLHDSETIEGVASEWALATHMTLDQSTTLLIQAEDGNRTGVYGLEPSVKHSASFQNILRQLHKLHPLTLSEHL